MLFILIITGIIIIYYGTIRIHFNQYFRRDRRVFQINKNHILLFKDI